MKRIPLTKNEMQEIITQLINAKPSLNDHEKALFLSGLKIGTLTGHQIPKQKEVFRLCDVIFEFQKQFDPDGLTWQKEDKASISD